MQARRFITSGSWGISSIYILVHIAVLTCWCRQVLRIAFEKLCLWCCKVYAVTRTLASQYFVACEAGVLLVKRQAVTAMDVKLLSSKGLPALGQHQSAEIRSHMELLHFESYTKLLWSPKPINKNIMPLPGFFYCYDLSACLKLPILDLRKMQEPEAALCSLDTRYFCDFHSAISHAGLYGSWCSAVIIANTRRKERKAHVHSAVCVRVFVCAVHRRSWITNSPEPVPYHSNDWEERH